MNGRDDPALTRADFEDRAGGKMKTKKEKFFLNICYLPDMIHCTRENVPDNPCYILTYCFSSHGVNAQNFFPQITKM